MKRDVDCVIEGTGARKRTKKNGSVPTSSSETRQVAKTLDNELTVQSSVVVEWKKNYNDVVARDEHKMEDDEVSDVGILSMQGLSGKINKSIERKFLNVLPEEKKRFNLTAAKTKTQQDTNFNIKSLWAPICLDLYMIKYLKKEYFEKNQRFDKLCNYIAPLAFVESSNIDASKLYTRIYKQLPLRFCIRLSIFRWIAKMIISALGESVVFSSAHLNFKDNVSGIVSKNERVNNIYVRCALQTTSFVDDLFSNIPNSEDYADTDVDILSQIDRLNNSHRVKTRFSLSEYGKQILSSSNKSFQPCVPHSIIPNIKWSLTLKNLLCSRRKKYFKSPSKLDEKTEILYTHEAEKLTDDVCLGAFPYELNALKTTRHSILIHLAGWPEGSAMFGLSQMFGTSKSIRFQNVIDSIFEFVDNLSTACVSSDDVKKLENYNKDNAETVAFSSEDEKDLYIWMDNIFEYNSEEEDSLEPTSIPSINRFPSKVVNFNLLEKNISKTAVCRTGYDSMNSVNNKSHLNAGYSATSATNNEVSSSLENVDYGHVVSENSAPSKDDSRSKHEIATTNVSQRQHNSTEKQDKSFNHETDEHEIATTNVSQRQHNSTEKQDKSFNHETDDKVVVINTTLNQNHFVTNESPSSNDFNGTVKFHATEARPAENSKTQNRRASIWCRCMLWLSSDYVYCRSKYPDHSIAELKMLQKLYRYYQKVALALSLQSIVVGIASGVLWRWRRMTLLLFILSRIFLILSVLSFVFGIWAICKASFFSRLIYEHEHSDDETEKEKQKSTDV